VSWREITHIRVLGSCDKILSIHTLLTYLLTPWCRVLLEQLTGLQLVKKSPAFHGSRRFITALTSVRHPSLSWASPIQSIYPHATSWRSILILSTHLRLGLPIDPILSIFWLILRSQQFTNFHWKAQLRLVYTFCIYFMLSFSLWLRKLKFLWTYFKTSVSDINFIFLFKSDY